MAIETQANSIATVIKYAPDVFDDVYIKESTASILRKNSADIQFTGAKTVRVAKRQFGALHPYHRNNVGDASVNGTTPYGYQSSAAGLTWEEHTLEMDRAAYYPIEMFDDEESGGKIVGTSITYIDQYILVPEIDAYCWSKIFSKAGKKIFKPSSGTDTNVNPITNPLKALHTAFKWEADHNVPENDQIVVASTAFQVALQETQEFGTTRFVDFDKSGNKDLAFNVIRYQGREITIVPPQRFKTEYNFDGEGFWPTSNAVDIDFIVMPKTAATHIVKYQKTRILEGEAATAMTHLDGYAILTRIYHDVIVFDNKRVAIYACAGYSAESNTVSDKYSFKLNSKHILKEAIFEKGDIYTVLAQGLTSGTDFDATSKVVLSNDAVYNHVLAVGQVVTGPIQILRVKNVTNATTGKVESKLAVVGEVAVTDGSDNWLTDIEGTIVAYN